MISILRKSMVCQMAKQAILALNAKTTTLILMDCAYMEYACVSGQFHYRRTVDYDRICLQ